MDRKELIRTVKFVLFSISAGVIEIVAYTLLEELTPWSYWACYLIALVLSVLWNFTLNREFTFRSANNVPVAMLKVAAYYAVFTPATTVLGNWLTETVGWNGYLVTVLNMVLNFVTEYLYDRFVVFGRSIDTNARAAEDDAAAVDWDALNDKKTPWTYKVIRRLVWLFSPKYRLVGAENLPDGPCVLVGNHSHMYGPVAGELYVPGRHSVWCAGEMMHREEVAAYAYQDFWSQKPRWTRWFYRLLSRIITPLSVLVLGSAHTIPVYHDARLITTFRRTLEELGEGARVVIFPESYTRHNNIIYRFHDRFIDIARRYCRQTGQALPFVPIYVGAKAKTLVFGEPVAFDPDAPLADERRRICEALMDGVTALAASLPEHTVVPYPNHIPRRRFPKNIPVEVYADETTDG